MMTPLGFDFFLLKSFNFSRLFFFFDLGRSFSKTIVCLLLSSIMTDCLDDNVSLSPYFDFLVGFLDLGVLPCKPRSKLPYCSYCLGRSGRLLHLNMPSSFRE